MSDTKDYGSPPPRAILKLFTHLNVLIYRASGGKLGGRLAGKDICIISMKGAKTGKTRQIPLMYVPYKQGILLVASQGGADVHPTWYHNLIANPAIKVSVHGKELSLTARLATAEEKEQVWPICVESYPDYENYRHRTQRDIPVFICE
jgi:deazaflavin-dependent oxidoreductase (nitroreductase family)